MRVAETAETLDYINGSKKPHKVRKFYAVFTRLLRRELRYTFCFFSPVLTWALECKRPLGCPFVFAGSGCLIERKHERRQRELRVWSSLEVQRQSSQPAGTFIIYHINTILYICSRRRWNPIPSSGFVYLYGNLAPFSVLECGSVDTYEVLPVDCTPTIKSV